MKMFAMCGAALLALTCTGSAAAVMTDEQRAELRERAAGLQTERQRNPGWDGGTTRLNDSRREVQPERASSEVNTRTAKEKRSRREPAEDRMTRKVKELPGSLVRRR
jgi:hypothetical protein